MPVVAVVNGQLLADSVQAALVVVAAVVLTEAVPAELAVAAGRCISIFSRKR